MTLEQSKTVLDVPVTVEKDDRWWKISIGIPRYKGKLHWIATDEQEANDIFNCINEDKVFMLQQAGSNASMSRVHLLVGLAITRRVGLR